MGETERREGGKAATGEDGEKVKREGKKGSERLREGERKVKERRCY